MSLSRKFTFILLIVATAGAWPAVAADQVALLIPPTGGRGGEAMPAVNVLNLYGNPKSPRSSSCTIAFPGGTHTYENCFELPTTGRVATIEKAIVDRQEADRHVVLKLVSELETRIRELESKVAELQEKERVRGSKG